MEAARSALERVKISRSAPKVHAANDFGTTFSGFAFIYRNNPSAIYTYFKWEGYAENAGMPYCKTITASLYEPFESGELALLKTGHPANLDFMDFTHVASKDYGERVNRTLPDGMNEKFLLERFKLLLASTEHGDVSLAADLPDGLTARQVVADYLREIKLLALQEITSKLGDHIRPNHVQWCLTVPAIWHDHAKQEMKAAAEQAGLVEVGEDAALMSCSLHSSQRLQLCIATSSWSQSLEVSQQVRCS
jgi:hypothetical protein